MKNSADTRRQRYSSWRTEERIEHADGKSIRLIIDKAIFEDRCT